MLEVRTGPAFPRNSGGGGDKSRRRSGSGRRRRRPRTPPGLTGRIRTVGKVGRRVPIGSLLGGVRCAGHTLSPSVGGSLPEPAAADRAPQVLGARATTAPEPRAPAGSAGCTEMEVEVTRRCSPRGKVLGLTAVTGGPVEPPSIGGAEGTGGNYPGARVREAGPPRPSLP